MNIVQYIKELEELKSATEALAESHESDLRNKRDDQKSKDHHHPVMDENGRPLFDTSGGKKFGEILKQNVEELDSREYLKKIK